MTTIDADAHSLQEQLPAEAAPAVTGDPALIGLPSFIVGSVALGLVLVGYVTAAGVGASLPIIVAATSVGLLVAAIWSAALGQSAVAGVFGIFAGFWLSYATLVLGLTHNWFAIAAGDALHTQGLYVISWLVVIGMLTLATLRLPMAYTVLFALIELALVLVLIGTLQQSTGTLKVAGVVVFVFAAVGVYLFFSSASQATGGKAFPLGQALVR
ncbi:acetate uptake transporter family protein [Kribbella sp. NBC_00662]|uniref:GPR1/FUN34/YaaH family transporter n=1 Tax=Kribbella sp. NBC_00662 TaxID=2975969 RepID=UPI00325461FB